VTIPVFATGAASFGGRHGLTDVPTANTKSPAFAPASRINDPGRRHLAKTTPV
jgi:hypothetical protein